MKVSDLQPVRQPLAGKHRAEPAAAQQRPAAVLTAERFLHWDTEHNNQSDHTQGKHLTGNLQVHVHV